MNSFYSVDELKELGVKSFGKGVLISRNAQIYNPELLVVGNHVRIDDFCILSGEITLGSFIHIAAYCALYGKYGIVMKNFTGLSARCTLYSASDNFNGDYLISPMTLEEHNCIISGAVILEEYVQVGANSIIMPGCVLNEGVAVGALSFVKESLDSWFLYTGIPVQKLKQRNKGLLRFVNDYK